MNAVKKKLAGGKETTSKGGRPTVPSQRKATQAEVVRLRGGGLTFQAIADELGISDRQAQILWDEYWEREHALSQESAEDVRISILTRLRLLRDTALAMATNPKVKISSTDPTGCTIELADFEKMAKMGKLALGCMTEEAKLCAAYDKPIEKEQPNVLSLIKFAELADKFCAENPNS